MKLIVKSSLTANFLWSSALEMSINSEAVAAGMAAWGEDLPSNVPSDSPRYQFGPFELDAAEGTLARNGSRVKLQDLPCRLLIMLVERPGEVVSRDEIRQRIWSADTFLEFDNSLGVAIRKVRGALGDDRKIRYLETVPRRGYRFSAPVTTLNGPKGRNSSDEMTFQIIKRSV
jgi:DNA-binding winged helix-turn-helix (wHTH) protein